jgi:hypothetical protein
MNLTMNHSKGSFELRPAPSQRIFSVTVWLLLGIFCLPLWADEKSDKWFDPALFHDPEDGEFDISAWLASRYGFLPVPIIITGPTLGAGGGVNLLFLHGKLAGKKVADGRRIPPSMSGVAAIATENGSRAAGAYHLGFMHQDRLRTTTFLGRPDLNLDFYPSILGREFKTRMNLDGWAFYQELKWRLAESNFFVGANYTYATVNSSLVKQQETLLEELLDQEYRIGGLGAVLEYDSRDTIFTPSRGAYGKLVLATHAEWLGSDYEFRSFRGKLFKYLPLSRDFDLGLRLEGQTVGSNAPYFLYPSVEMRGIPNKRYQGQDVLVGEAELNWRVHGRWHLIGFAGGGKAFGEEKLKRQDVSFADASWRTSKGLGFRYELARKFGLQAGVDVAWGPEETAFYITVGSAWNAFY